MNTVTRLAWLSTHLAKVTCTIALKQEAKCTTSRVPAMPPLTEVQATRWNWRLHPSNMPGPNTLTAMLHRVTSNKNRTIRTTAPSGSVATSARGETMHSIFSPGLRPVLSHCNRMPGEVAGCHFKDSDPNKLERDPPDYVVFSFPIPTGKGRMDGQSAPPSATRVEFAHSRGNLHIHLLLTPLAKLTSVDRCLQCRKTVVHKLRWVCGAAMSQLESFFGMAWLVRRSARQK